MSLEASGTPGHYQTHLSSRLVAVSACSLGLCFRGALSVTFNASKAQAQLSAQKRRGPPGSSAQTYDGNVDKTWCCSVGEVPLVCSVSY